MWNIDTVFSTYSENIRYWIAEFHIHDLKLKNIKVSKCDLWTNFWTRQNQDSNVEPLEMKTSIYDQFNTFLFGFEEKIRNPNSKS